MQDLSFILLILIVIIDILVIIGSWRISSIIFKYGLQEDNLEVDPEDNEDNEIIMRVLSS